MLVMYKDDTILFNPCSIELMTVWTHDSWHLCEALNRLTVLKLSSYVHSETMVGPSATTYHGHASKLSVKKQHNGLAVCIRQGAFLQFALIALMEYCCVNAPPSSWTSWEVSSTSLEIRKLIWDSAIEVGCGFHQSQRCAQIQPADVLSY